MGSSSVIFRRLVELRALVCSPSAEAGSLTHLPDRGRQYVRDNLHSDHGACAPCPSCKAAPVVAGRGSWPTFATLIGRGTAVQELFGLTKPIFLAGMNVAAGPELAAAVSNEGGLGVIGGVGATVEYLRDQCKKIKDGLVDKSAPWGIDLLLPQVGGSARKTNKDYTKGELPELIDVIIEEGASLFVSAVGVPPKFAVDKLHAVRIQPTASTARTTCAPPYYTFVAALSYMKQH